MTKSYDYDAAIGRAIRLHCTGSETGQPTHTQFKEISDRIGVSVGMLRNWTRDVNGERNRAGREVAPPDSCCGDKLLALACLIPNELEACGWVDPDPARTQSWMRERAIGSTVPELKARLGARARQLTALNKTVDALNVENGDLARRLKEAADELETLRRSAGVPAPVARKAALPVDGEIVVCCSCKKHDLESVGWRIVGGRVKLVVKPCPGCVDPQVREKARTRGEYLKRIGRGVVRMRKSVDEVASDIERLVGPDFSKSPGANGNTKGELGDE